MAYPSISSRTSSTYTHSQLTTHGALSSSTTFCSSIAAAARWKHPAISPDGLGPTSSFYALASTHIAHHRAEMPATSTRLKPHISPTCIPIKCNHRAGCAPDVAHGASPPRLCPNLRSDASTPPRISAGRVIPRQRQFYYLVRARPWTTRTPETPHSYRPSLCYPSMDTGTFHLIFEI